MKNYFTARRLCRAGVIAALYVALTYAFGSISYQGLLQIRPAEALCVLPLLYGEAVPALFIGCAISNIGSPFFLYDVTFGSLTTLLAAVCTYLVGKAVRKDGLRLALGGLFPVLLNGFIIPLIVVFLCNDTGNADSLGVSYLACCASLILTEAVWVYGLGTPLYFSVLKMKRRGD